MIEVEKKFQPTEEQLKALLKDADFICDKINHDIYYDYGDYKLMKERVRLRNRNGNFELKLGQSRGVNIEIENKKEIEDYFKTNNLEEFIKQNFVVIIEYTTKRTEYRKGEFIIDVDRIDFGFNLCEIELMVKNEDEVKEAKDKIKNFAKEYGWEITKILPKGLEYLRIFKPEIYKELI
jgi:predicted adenylyl cyclase CyaB